jgi:hypothetical protein
MIWSVPPIWEDGEVWILGGGPSVTKQFGISDDVVNDVINKVKPPSAYSPYMEAIHKKHVIGINVAFLIGKWMDVCFFGDGKFFQPNKEALAQWPGLKVTCSPGLSRIPWVKYLARDSKHTFGISSKPNSVSWNVNSGSAAVSMAANAGAKRIILVGFDMTLGKDGSKHWHKLYQPTLSPQDVRGLRRIGIQCQVRMPFQRHLHGFPQMLKDAQARGIEIINACPESAITVFPKCNVKDLL